MRVISESIKNWLDLKKPASEPLELKEGAPEEVKKEFEEWKQKKPMMRKQGYGNR